MMPLWVLELSELFWSAVGGPGPFPRDLGAALKAGAFDVTVKELAGLSIRKAENYLAHQGIFRTTGEPERLLRACVIAHGGAAWIFLERDDPPEEKAASLAHEVAHFLRQCLQPRRRAADADRRLLAVLDGGRPPTHPEQFHALLRGLDLRPHVHYLRRDGSSAERQAEEEADLLAWHLLAPCDEVRRRLGDRRGDRDAAQALLTEAFGLPPGVASAYADYLHPERDESPVVNKLLEVRGGGRRPRRLAGE
jgi:hypothetical protein